MRGRRISGRRPRRVPALLAALTVAAVLAGGAGAGAAAAAPASGPAPAEIDIPETDTVEPGPCPIEVPEAQAERVSCGILTVPERRGESADPERVIRLPFAVVASIADAPQRDPLVVPSAGDPAGGALGAVSSFLDGGRWATGERDVVIVEQRGDLLSEPSLDCPELGLASLAADGRLGAGPDAAAARDDALTACRDRLLADGVDLSAYMSAASAADLADLRTALGYDQWNLYGAASGARLALTVMRDRPEGLRAVILDGATPPNVDDTALAPAGFASAVDAVVQSCAADADCAARYPGLGDRLTEVLDRAAQQPISVTGRSPDDGSPLVVALDDLGLAGLFARALADPRAARVLPLVVDRLASGQTDAALPLVQRDLDAADRPSEGLAWSLRCAEEVPFDDPAAADAAYAADPIGAALRPDEPAAQDCAIWGVPALPELEAQAVSSPVPTLITVGGYDPVSTDAAAQAAASGLSASRTVSFPSLGAAAIRDGGACPAWVARQFLTDPLAELDTSCVAGMPATDFLTASDVQPTTALYRLQADVVQWGSPAQSLLVITALAVFAFTLVYAGVYGVLRSAGRAEEAAPGTVLTATASAGFFLVFAAALGLLLGTDPLALQYGIPPAAWLLFLLPMIALAVAALLVVLLVPAWRRDEGGRAHRVVFSITAAVAIVFGVWLLTRGLLFV